MVNQRPNIWKLQADKDIDGLVAALQHSDPDIRRRSAAALRVLGSTKAIFGLERAVEREKDPTVKDHLRAALEHLDRDEIVNSLIQNRDVTGLVDILHSPHNEDVLRATKALGEIGDRLATEGLVMVFRSPVMSDDIRLAAAEALLQLESAPAVVTLLGALRKDNWRVRHNAAAVLGQLRATWATKPLIETLQKDENPMVRRTVAAALRRFNTPQALQALETNKDRIRGNTGKLPTIPLQPESSEPSVEETPEIKDTNLGEGLPEPVAVSSESDAESLPIATIATPSETETAPLASPTSVMVSEAQSQPLPKADSNLHKKPIVVLGDADEKMDTMIKPPADFKKSIQEALMASVNAEKSSDKSKEDHKDQPTESVKPPLPPKPMLPLRFAASPTSPNTPPEDLASPKPKTDVGSGDISDMDDTITERPSTPFPPHNPAL